VPENDSLISLDLNVLSLCNRNKILSARKYPAFQSLLELRGQIRESLQFLNLNTGPHLDKLLASQQKQTATIVQFLQNRGRLPDVIKCLKDFNQAKDEIPEVLDCFSMRESVQPSIRHEKVRDILEFYSLTLLYSFLSYHAPSVSKPLVTIHKRQRKFRMDSPLLTTLLEETRSLQSEAQRSQAATMRVVDLLLRIEVACLDTGLRFGKSHHRRHPETIPPILILNLTGAWQITPDEIREHYGNNRI
jgi:hypothetical protein